MDDFKPQTQQNTEPAQPVVQSEGPERYETPSGQPTQLESTPEPIPQKKSNAGKWVVWGVVVLFLAGLGALAFWQYQQIQKVTVENTYLQNALKASQDAYKKDVAAQKADEAEKKNPPTDSELVSQEATRYIVGQGGTLGAAKDRTMTTKKLQSPFAAVSATAKSAGGGLDLLLKKVEEEWVVIWSGNGEPTAAEKTQYGVPAGFYPAS